MGQRIWVWVVPVSRDNNSALMQSQTSLLRHTWDQNLHCPVLARGSERPSGQTKQHLFVEAGHVYWLDIGKWRAASSANGTVVPALPKDMSFHDTDAVQQYGPTWRMIHKMIHNILNIKAAVTYVPYQDLENKFMLLGLLNQPDEFANHMRRYTNSLTTQMVFGFRTLDINDPKLQQLFHVSYTDFRSL